MGSGCEIPDRPTIGSGRSGRNAPFRIGLLFGFGSFDFKLLFSCSRTMTFEQGCGTVIVLVNNFWRIFGRVKSADFAGLML